MAEKLIPARGGVMSQFVTLNESNRFAMRILGAQTPEAGVKFRESRFVITEGDAKYNSLTGEALLGIHGPPEVAAECGWPRKPDEAEVHLVHDNGLQCSLYLLLRGRHQGHDHEQADSRGRGRVHHVP